MDLPTFKSDAFKELYPHPQLCCQTNPTTGNPCHIAFADPDLLAAHEDLVHNIPGSNFACLACPDGAQIFGHVEDLNQHYRNNHPDQATPEVPPGNLAQKVRQSRVCNLCQQSFHSVNRLLRHYERKHSKNGERTRIHQCRECDRTFSRNVSLELHTRLVHFHAPRLAEASPSRKASNLSSCPSDSAQSSHPGGRPEDQLDGAVTATEIPCPFQRCDQIAFRQQKDLVEHIRCFHGPPGTTSKNVQPPEVSTSAPNSPARPSSCASMSSCDSGISHPPRTGKDEKKKKKVAAWSPTGKESRRQTSGQTQGSVVASSVSVFENPYDVRSSSDFVRQYIESLPDGRHWV